MSRFGGSIAEQDGGVTAGAKPRRFSVWWYVQERVGVGGMFKISAANEARKTRMVAPVSGAIGSLALRSPDQRSLGVVAD